VEGLLTIHEVIPDSSAAAIRDFHAIAKNVGLFLSSGEQR